VNGITLHRCLPICGLVSGLLCGLLVVRAEPAPEYGWTTPARVLRVIDGDTLEVEVRRTVRVRLLDCWAPESKSDSRVAEQDRDRQKTLGLAAKASLQRVAEDQDVIVRIPTQYHGDISQLFTMGRVLGHVWLRTSPQESLSERQVRLGHATKTKPEELK